MELLELLRNRRSYGKEFSSRKVTKEELKTI